MTGRKRGRKPGTKITDPKGRMIRRKDGTGEPIDWTIVREYYITNLDETYADTARFFNISVMTLHTRATKEGWVRERALYTDELIARTRDAAMQRMANDAPGRWHELLARVGAVVNAYLEYKKRSLESGELEAHADAATQGEKEEGKWRQRTITKKPPMTERQAMRLVELYTRMLSVPLGFDIGIGLPHDGSSRTAAKLWGGIEDGPVVEFVSADVKE